MLDIDFLKQYKDACAICEEIDKEIEQLHKDRNVVVSDCVTGSDNQYPYIARKYTISGVLNEESDSKSSAREKSLLARKAAAELVREQIDSVLEDAPLRIQRIIRYKFIAGLSWERVADKMGGKATGDSIRMELNRYLKKV